MKKIAVVLICLIAVLMCACNGDNQSPERQYLITRLDVPVEFHGVWQGDETVNHEVLTISATDIESAGLGSMVEIFNELDMNNRMLAEKNGVKYWSNFDDSSPYDGVYILGYTYIVYSTTVSMVSRLELQNNGEEIKLTMNYTGLEGLPLPDGFPAPGTTAIYAKVK